ncbi:MAG TPA: alpha/beta fold hydrolase [Acidimicrobiales bacterium]
MTVTDGATTDRTGPVRAGDVDLWVDQRGAGPDVVLIAGLSDPAEAWEAQLDGLSGRYRVTAFDNRGAGRSPEIPEGFTVADMAEDTAALVQALGIPSAHVAGFSGGAAVAQELALRHPDVVRSLVLVSTWARPYAYVRAMMDTWRWLIATAPSDRAGLEAFFTYVYTRRAHEDGTVGQIVEESLAFPHPQSTEGFQRQVAAYAAHDALDRLHGITAPTLVVAGEEDIIAPPRYNRDVAERVPGAELVVLPGEAHQPFQERPAEFNALVDGFWSRLDGRR